MEDAAGNQEVDASALHGSRSRRFSIHSWGTRQSFLHTNYALNFHNESHLQLNNQFSGYNPTDCAMLCPSEQVNRLNKLQVD